MDSAHTHFVYTMSTADGGGTKNGYENRQNDPDGDEWSLCNMATSCYRADKV